MEEKFTVYTDSILDKQYALLVFAWLFVGDVW